MKKIKLLVIPMALLMFFSACKNNPENSEKEPDSENYSELFDRKEILVPSATLKPEENLSGELIVLTEEDFRIMITEIDNPKGFQYKGETPCVVDFYADWCAPCVKLNPILIELAEEYKGRVIFYKLNTDRAVNTANAFQVSSIPTLLLFKPNSIITVIEGALPKEELKNAIETVLLSEN